MGRKCGVERGASETEKRRTGSGVNVGTHSGPKSRKAIAPERPLDKHVEDDKASWVLVNFWYEGSRATARDVG